MHSRIFQIDTQKINEDSLIDIETAQEYFVDEVSDYVKDDDNIKESISELINMLEPHGIIYDKSEKSITFEKGFKKSYFKKSYDNFVKFYKSIDFEAFCVSLPMNRLVDIISKSNDYYVLYSSGEYDTLDTYIRDNVLDGEKHYIGSIFDYHK
ncbi:hypothetical protein U729_3224 (plasmid) [Clostridium baratii str. Sullivan]|uniref:Uncharacterized protein n=1 Tax=Clostridium baratii str. Sullivan TaxID=1415775 RepID=A0A0A7G050_9CLOT|nr:hypothetical protein [Clostridium baratii]AIY85249.1 hypothetical protein U729_3224 [Clostridium baratii str. Sullivan]